MHTSVCNTHWCLTWCSTTGNVAYYEFSNGSTLDILEGCNDLVVSGTPTQEIGVNGVADTALGFTHPSNTTADASTTFAFVSA